MSSKNAINNPDLHLGLAPAPTTMKKALEKILAMEFTLITDILDFDFEKNKPEVWIHLRKDDNKKYPSTLSVYGTLFTLEHTQLLAAELNCQIITDFDQALKQHQWQKINPDGSIEVVSGLV